MNKTILNIFFTAFAVLALSSISNAQTLYSNDFSDADQNLNIIGRGDCRICDGVFGSESSYAVFGDEEWKNYSVSFRARAPKNAEQVQIWAGFRANNRFDRYVIGLKGGLQDDLYLMRLGYMGTDEFMGVRPLGFHPEPGEWYKIRIEVCGSRIRVFLNGEDIPRMDLTDKNSNLAPSGGVTLGGGWIETQFDDLVVTQLSPDALDNIEVKEYSKVLTLQQKETVRRQQRAGYNAVVVKELSSGRTDISLDGDWLFMPDYELSDRGAAVAAATDDNDWHVMNVPDFWNPIRIWLHGETMPSPTGAQPKGVSDTYYQRETARCESYTFDYRKTKAAWYRQWIELPEAVDGKTMTLTFDAVSKLAEVYVNGTMAASHVGMFGEIKVDASKLLHAGKNLVVVKVTRDYVDNIDDADKVVDVAVTVPVTNKMLKDIAHGFYGDDPAGIWQPVRLTVSGDVKVEDVFIKQSLSGAEMDVTVCNHSGKRKQFDLYTDIVDKETRSVLYSGLSLHKVALNGGEEQMFTYSVNDLKPRLWSPQHPALYDFKFRIVDSKGVQNDENVITSGFRTFEVKDGLFYLNGVPYWLRGGNHTPFALAPNDLNLANTFYQLMKRGNIEVTRTHTTPYNKLWMTAADVNGVGISFEGTWPWLMLSNSMPEMELIEMWKEEFLGLMKKYRNHPSLLFWTVNNEMKFYDNDSDKERAMRKMRIISDVVEQMRTIDPTRPICFDSNYQAKGKKEKFGEEFMATIDDGDIDDIHGYYNWYDYSLFRFFNGEFQKNFKMPDRPLISQEMSTGYPNNETGHPTRSYQLIHQNPYTLIGYEAYDFADPQSFLNVQSFITGELAEALRRSDDQASGVLHFALLTWFRQVYDYQNIEPYPTYYALKRALQPVLVSAELWGRNLYAGEKLPVRVYVVNDREDGTGLQPSLLRWKIVDDRGETLTCGSETIPAVEHYKRVYIEPDIVLPDDSHLPGDKSKVKLVLNLTEGGLSVSENEYDLLLARKSWNKDKVGSLAKIVLIDGDGTGSILDSLGVLHVSAANIVEALNQKPELLIMSALSECSQSEKEMLRRYQAVGGKLLLLNSKEVSKTLYPEYVNGWIIPTEGDIVNMERNDSPVFDGIGVLELRYFNNNKREIPTVCNATMKINRNENVIELAGQMKIHAYIDGGTQQDRIDKIDSMRGLTLFQVNDGAGSALVSTMCTEKALTDPVAGRLLVNMINLLVE